MFSPEDIQSRLKDQPFVPVRIVTSPGQMFDIYHPDPVVVGRRSLIGGTASTENPRQFEVTTRIAIWHVSALEDLPAPAVS